MAGSGVSVGQINVQENRKYSLLVNKKPQHDQEINHY